MPEQSYGDTVRYLDLCQERGEEINSGILKITNSRIVTNFEEKESVLHDLAFYLQANDIRVVFCEVEVKDLFLRQ